MSLRKFEFGTEELAIQFIQAHQSEELHKVIIGPMRMPIAWEGEGEERVPVAFTGYMVDTDGVDPLPGWEDYIVTPKKPLHHISGREQEYQLSIQ